MDLQDKTVLVTGASSGIGREIAALLYKERARIVCVDIKESPVVSEINEADGKAIGVKADVSNEDDMRNAFDVAMKEFGSIDVVINNAGITPTKPIEETSYDEFLKTMRINTGGAFLGVKLAREVMDEGIIINTGSSQVFPHCGVKNWIAYGASKFGVIGIVSAAAKEFEGEIKLYAVNPHGTATSSSGNVGGSPVEVAEVFLKVLKQDDRYHSGSAIEAGDHDNDDKEWPDGPPTVEIS